MTWRRLAVLIDNLPSDSAFRTEVRDSMTPQELQRASVDSDPNVHGRWTLNDQLAARNGDLIEWLIWMTAAQNTPKGKPRPRKPEPYPRPGVPAKSGRVRFTDAVKADLEELRANRGAVALN